MRPARPCRASSRVPIVPLAKDVGALAKEPQVEVGVIRSEAMRSSAVLSGIRFASFSQPVFLSPRAMPLTV